MKRFAILFTLTCGLALVLSAQSAPNIRNPDINSESPDGALITQAAMAESPADRIPPLEQMLSEHADSKYKGYALLQLQQAYLAQQNHAKVIEVGRELLKIVPE